MTQKPPRPSGSNRAVASLTRLRARDRVEVGNVLALLPDPAALLDELVDAVGSEPVGLGCHARRCGQLVDRDLASDVEVTEVVQGAPASMVAAVRA